METIQNAEFYFHVEKLLFGLIDGKFQKLQITPDVFFIDAADKKMYFAVVVLEDNVPKLKYYEQSNGKVKSISKLPKEKKQSLTEFDNGKFSVSRSKYNSIDFVDIRNISKNEVENIQHK